MSRYVTSNPDIILCNTAFTVLSTSAVGSNALFYNRKANLGGYDPDTKCKLPKA